MRFKGFILMEIIVGLSILGLITITCLPILSICIKNLNEIKENTEMIYICEMVVEKIKTMDETAQLIIQELEVKGSYEYKGDDFDSNKYSCHIDKIKDDKKLIEFNVKISKRDQENTPYVEFKTAVSKTHGI